MATSTKTRAFLVGVTVFVLALTNLQLHGQPEPSRDADVSAHALPKRIAAMRGSPWGLEISYGRHLQPEDAQPYLQSLEEVVAFMQKQSPEVRDNGLWVVTTHPSVYSEEENRFFESIKRELPSLGIPLYWVRGAELPNGFTRIGPTDGA